MENLYLPSLMTVEEIIRETSDVKTFRLTFQDEGLREGFDFRSGQFALYSVFGRGEATFCIASSPTQKGYIECSIKRAGRVTMAFHELNVGDTVGFRGPYGNSFPIEEMHGKSLIFVGGSNLNFIIISSLTLNCNCIPIIL